MIFGFDEHKGKVDVGAMLTQLQTNFQNNVNTLYNAFVAKGVTPAAKTVSAIVTAVTTLYNKGVTDAQAVEWENNVLTSALYNNESTITSTKASVTLECTNMVSIRNSSNLPGTGSNYIFYDANGNTISSGNISSTTPIAVPSNAKTLNIWRSANRSTSANGGAVIKYRAKELR